MLLREAGKSCKNAFLHATNICSATNSLVRRPEKTVFFEKLCVFQRRNCSMLETMTTAAASVKFLQLQQPVYPRLLQLSDT